MPTVTIKVAALAVDLRLSADPTQDPDEPTLSLITSLRDASAAQCEQYAGPDTPQATLNLACSRMAAALYESPAYADKPQLIFDYSGARAILAAWHVPESV